MVFLCAFSGCSKESGGGDLNVVNQVYHEVYIEQGMTDNDKGLVVGLPDSSIKTLESADKIYDGETELSFENGKIVNVISDVPRVGLKHIDKLFKGYGLVDNA